MQVTKDLSWLRELPGRPLVVAEVKDRTPFNPDYHASDRYVQLRICEEIGDVISIHTNPLWGGSWEWLAEVCKRATKPVLAKGFHPTIRDVERALDCGATHVLTVGWHPGGDLAERCWMECETFDQLRDQPSTQRCVWNARNPRTGETRWEDDAQLMWTCVKGYNSQRRPSVSLPAQPWLCQASRIRGPDDVVAGVDAILIGEGLYT